VVKHPDAARSPEMSKDEAAEGNFNLKRAATNA
jgi:hypothetical protein